MFELIFGAFFTIMIVIFIVSALGYILINIQLYVMRTEAKPRIDKVKHMSSKKQEILGVIIKLRKEKHPDENAISILFDVVRKLDRRIDKINREIEDYLLP